MFVIEADYIQVCTCTISDEDEQRIRDYIKLHPKDFEFTSEEESIIKAISILDINLYDDHVESDGYTNDVRWSGFEERSAEEILNR